MSETTKRTHAELGILAAAKARAHLRAAARLLERATPPAVARGVAPIKTRRPWANAANAIAEAIDATGELADFLAAPAADAAEAAVEARA